MAAEENAKWSYALALAVVKCKPKHMSAKDYCVSIGSRLLSEKTLHKVDPTDQIEQIEHTETQSVEIVETAKEIEPKCDKTQPDRPNRTSAFNLKTVRAIDTVKNSIVALQGFILTEPSEKIDTVQSQLHSQHSQLTQTQDSGFPESAPHLGNSQRNKLEKKMDNLNSCILTLLELLTETERPSLRTYIFDYVSDILGEIVDVLYQKNILLPSLSVLADSSERYLNKSMNEGNIEDLSIFYSLNKSRKILQFTLSELGARLEETSEGLAGADPETAEARRIKTIEEDLFFLLDSIGRLLDVRRRKERSASEETLRPSEDDRAKDPTAAKLAETLNRIVIRGVDRHPLASYWALEIITKNEMNAM